MLNKLDLSTFRGDLTGGITAAVVALPMALTFGVASGAGAEAGLYGAIIIGLFAALFGGTPTLISEPTGPMTVVMTAVITTMMAKNPENGMAMAFTVVMVAGAFQMLMGALKLGRYITLMPYSVISGFMSGIGLILIIIQIGPMLGQSAPSGGAVSTITSLPDLISAISTTELGLALIALAILFFYPKQLKRYLPPQLFALILLSIVSVILFDSDELRRIGEINVGIPSVNLPYFTPEQVTEIILDGIVLGMLGCIDSMLTSVIADNLTRTEHNSNKELVGQGIGNIVSGLLGGLPGAGATMGTVVNIQAGGRTHLSGVIRALILIVVVYGLAFLIAHIPLAVLAAIAVKVGVDILDWSFIKRAHRISWQTTGIMYAVMFLTVTVDLIVAVGAGIFVANIIIIEKLRIAQQDNIKAISDVDDATPLSREERKLLNASNGQILLVYLSGPMIFAMSKTLSKQSSSIKKQRFVILDLSDVPMMDDTMLLAIENTINDLKGKNKEIYLVVNDQSLKDKLERIGTIELIGASAIVETRKAALESANLLLTKSTDAPPLEASVSQ
ncbi:SulP family inorganic anion transporter [Aestuariibacter sp. AA17]|uniref:SulP family inorganic anion transporter n=1 Tax=Fluctibacter corallii TaxID=2984329 RepID=A0ABT3A781_9ALTE|nr:SulP family inorganic anion transporter [Aestuariibacter sp. AA17]MCV2884541.1 SulP family inorganic anion transporter [Aestuariibacter sp. AA17]